VKQFRSELLKISSTRTTIGLVLGMIALVLLFTLLGGLLTPASDLADDNNQFQVLGAGNAAVLFSALVGVMLVTTEFRYGTIRPTFLYEPRRERVIAAKVAAGLATGLVFGLVASALALGVGLLVLSGRGIDRAFGGGELAQIALGAAAVAALWAAIGVGFGAILRHQVGAIVALLAYVFVAESIVFGLVPSVGRYLPGPAGQALTGDTNGDLVSAAAGAGLLLAYAVAIAAIGTALTAKRDID
jgi:ABC-2 type transport system permease protein